VVYGACISQGPSVYHLDTGLQESSGTPGFVHCPEIELPLKKVENRIFFNYKRLIFT
jgi:hypothetical protein